jgi:hypothetical protein
MRAHFIPHEDLRDAWSPAKVLHHATDLAGHCRNWATAAFPFSFAGRTACRNWQQWRAR